MLDRNVATTYRGRLMVSMSRVKNVAKVVVHLLLQLAADLDNLGRVSEAVEVGDEVLDHGNDTSDGCEVLSSPQVTVIPRNAIMQLKLLHRSDVVLSLSERARTAVISFFIR